MANTFYSYLAFIAPNSNASLSLLKNNLETFYQKGTIENKPDIVLDNNQIDIIFDDDYQLHIAFSEEEYEFDWNENVFDKAKLETCHKRFEIWGDDDFDMDYFNDSLFVIEEIENFSDVIIFSIQ
jgi:hypothetical protein